MFKSFCRFQTLPNLPSFPQGHPRSHHVLEVPATGLIALGTPNGHKASIMLEEFKQAYERNIRFSR